MVAQTSESVDTKRPEFALEAIDIDALDRNEAMGALNRILASRRFRNSVRICDFLRYVVVETLDRRGALIKARTIAVDVFGRENFDDDAGDAIVRTSAHRLRMLIEGYFHDEGALDPYRISLPTGSYVPTFHRRLSVSAVAKMASPQSGVSVMDKVNGAQNHQPGSADAKRKMGGSWSQSVRANAIPIALLLFMSFLFLAILQMQRGSTEEDMRPASISIVMSGDPDLPGNLVVEVRRRLIANLVAFKNATIVEGSHSEGQVGNSCRFTLDVSIIKSGELVVDWKLFDSASGAVVGTGNEKLESLTYASLDDSTKRIAGKVLNIDGLLSQWSELPAIKSSESFCRPSLLPLYQSAPRDAPLRGDRTS